MSHVQETIPNAATALIDTLIASNLGDRHAFSYNDRRYSYQDVAALMNRAANLLQGLGVEPSASVLLLLPSSPALVASVLGVIKAGAAPLLGAPTRSDALVHCVATTGPAAAVVHGDRLPEAESALAAIRHDAVVVVGADARDYKSFVEEMRRQASWFAAPDIGPDAVALRFWTGSGVDETSHAELTALIRRDGDDPGGASDERAAVVATLRTFARGEEALLTQP